MNHTQNNDDSMTDDVDERAEATPRGRGRLAKSLFSTVPIVLAGSMAMSMNLTGPITPAQAKTPKNDRANPTQLGKTIRQQLAAAHAASTAEATSAGVVEVAAAPSSYTVVAGDTVGGIAGRFGIPTASVLAMNGLGWKSTIYPGQVLKLGSTTVVPAPAPVAAPAPSGGSYTIVSGDTVGGIARRLGVSTQSLLAANGLSATSTIYAGRTLSVPGSTSAPAPVTAAPVSAPVAAAPTTGSYTIVSGDTIGGIARKFGVSTQSVLAANSLTASSIIFAGRTLTIPGQASPAAASAAPIVTVSAPVASTNVANTAHVIKSGETIAGIAASYGVSIQAILSANGLGWSSIIYSGRTLVIPAVTVTAATVDGVTPLTPEMTQNANVIISVGRSVGAPDAAIIVALAAAMQESSLRNIDFGDLDSLGLFQQRPSAGWGAPEQLTDPVYASRLFYGGSTAPNRGVTRGLLDIPGWQSMTLTQAAQAVQISAYPDAYAKWEKSARAWFDDLT